MRVERLPFIDWMKSLGMALIVLGHVGADLIYRLTPPFNLKQLGVAFFLFSTGYSLAEERRPSWVVLPRRLFEILLWGGVFALVMSAITYAQTGDLNESNYLPLLGLNFIFNDFPANSTTWFIGTYIHVLLIWAVALRYLRPRAWMLIPVALAEIVIRAFILYEGKPFTAYMLVTNWATVFLLGLLCGRAAPEVDSSPRTPSLVWPLGALGLLAVWPMIAWPVLKPARGSFPFMTFTTGSTLADLALTSAAVTLLYAAYTWSTYQITRRLPDWAPARFFARNTLIIFIVHMPIYWEIQPRLARVIENHFARAAILFFLCFVVLGFVSEALRRLVHPTALRDWILSRERRKSPQHVQAG